MAGTIQFRMGLQLSGGAVGRQMVKFLSSKAQVVLTVTRMIRKKVRVNTGKVGDTRDTSGRLFFIPIRVRDKNEKLAPIDAFLDNGDTSSVYYTRNRLCKPIPNQRIKPAQ